MSNFYIHKFGRNADVDAATDDLWDFGSNYQFPTVATSTEIVGIANDLPNSDGVHSVVVEGLLADGTEVSEVATLNGATPVVLTNSFFRVNRMYVDTVGASGTNSGNIDVSHSGSATLGRINPSEGQTMQAIYTMPAGVSGHFTRWSLTAGRFGAGNIDTAASVRLQTRESGKGWRTKDSARITDQAGMDRHYKGRSSSLALKPLTDIRVRFTAINTNNIEANGSFEIEAFRDVR